MSEHLDTLINRFPGSLLRTTEDDPDAIIENIRNADMVCTDHCGIAMVAAALSVNRITCFEMAGDPDLLSGISEIKRFSRRSGGMGDQYGQMLDYVAREWDGYERYPGRLNQEDPGRFIHPLALKYCRGQGLDVGPNQGIFPGARASGADDRHFDLAPFDFIFSSHCLEYIVGWREELTRWRDSLRPDGIIFCYVPHPLCEGYWARGGGHVNVPDPIELFRFMRYELGMEVLQYSSRPDPCWGWHIVARKK